MRDLYISFYLRANRVRVFSDVLRAIGSPKRICFLIDKSGENLLIAPHDNRDFKSHKVPPQAVNGKYGVEICSIKLCRIIADLHGWDITSSYRVPGTAYPERNAAVFRLAEAEAIERRDTVSAW